MGRLEVLTKRGELLFAGLKHSSDKLVRPLSDEVAEFLALQISKIKKN